jgi:hypothetical protein
MVSRDRIFLLPFGFVMRGDRIFLLPPGFVMNFVSVRDTGKIIGIGDNVIRISVMNGTGIFVFRTRNVPLSRRYYRAIVQSRENACRRNRSIALPAVS